MRKNKLAMLEAALFMSNEPMKLEKMCKVLKIKPNELLGLIEVFKTNLNSEERGLHLLKTDEGYQLRVKTDYVKNVSGLTPFKDLGKGLLRVLALIAYKQPMTQSDIVKVIGNRTYEYVKRLRQKGFIRGERKGRSRSLFLTKEFADYFGLSSVEDAKRLLGNFTVKNEEEEPTEEEE